MPGKRNTSGGVSKAAGGHRGSCMARFETFVAYLQQLPNDIFLVDIGENARTDNCVEIWFATKWFVQLMRTKLLWLNRDENGQQTYLFPCDQM